MTTPVFGAGYVGHVTGTYFSNAGHEVFWVDVDESKIDGLKKGVILIHELYQVKAAGLLYFAVGHVELLNTLYS